MAEIQEKEHWADLYRRALFEEDGSKLPLMLERARQAVQQRVRELWHLTTRGQSVSAKERQDLHTAAYYLDLLRSLEVRKRIGRDHVETNEHMLPGLWTSET
ncbi:MAG: hypothetical protein ACM3WP_08955 [Acidobacteriota bacterium]